MAKSDNSSLHNSKRAKEDEFYTLLGTIEEELKHYRRHFKGKTVLCNCDDPFESNFFKYFVLNFNRLQLKKLLATCYVSSPIMGKQLSLFDVLEDAQEGTPYRAVVTKVYDATGNGSIGMSDVATLFKQRENELTTLQGDGDFRSSEVIDLLKDADIVVTNPPFSLFREYTAQLMEYSKQFLIIGNTNALTYKEFFPLLKENRIWLGYHCGHTMFDIPDYYKIPDKYDKSDRKKLRENGYIVDENGKLLYRDLGNICWFTNLDHKKRHEDIVCTRRYAGNEANYPRYDNYDAIEVPKVVDIPLDYTGVMGVPISFMEKYCPEQFDIVDGRDIALFARQQNKKTMLLKDADTAINGKPTYARVCIRYTSQWIADHAEDFKEV